MNKHLDQRNKFLERQLATLYASRPAGAGEVVQVQTGPDLGLSLRIPSRGSPPLFGGPPSPASTQSEPIFLKTEEQDDIDQIIAPTRHLHVRHPTFPLPSPPNISSGFEFDQFRTS
jgi:hypothetical protein